MVSVIVPSYGGFESLGFPPPDHLKYQLGCVPSSSSVSAVQSKNLSIHQSNSPINTTTAITHSISAYSNHRKRKVLVMDASKGNGGPPILRSPLSSSLYKPLFVDCSVEYELPNVPKVPKNSLPLLVIHPGYEPKNNQHHSESGSSSANNRMARKRDASSLQQPNSNNYINIHSSSTTRHPPHPLYSSSISAAKGNAYSGCCYSVPSTPAPMSEALNGSPPSAKRSRPSNDWLRHQRRLCEQQQLKRYHQQQQQQQQQQHLVSVQQQQHLWRLNSCPPLIHHSWSGTCCNSNCCPSNKMWLHHQQQQLYAKQQQQQQEAYYQQQLLGSSGGSGSSSLCPGCISGKCLFVWNKENLSAYRC